MTAAALDGPTIDELVRVLRLQAAGPPADKGDKFTIVEDGSPAVPAGVTYFAQFVDHDITFDPTPTFESRPTPHALVDFRTPRLDLDSLYGTGPSDQPYLYDWIDYEVKGAKLLVAHFASNGKTFGDLPRNSQGRALIGDPRNDEHVIIAQLHLLCIGFHNAVVEYLHDELHLHDDDLFVTAREIVRWHYQWIVTHEFLALIVGDAMASSVLVPGGPGEAPSVRLEHYRLEDGPFIPLEFSAAAYRFGHSMVRDSYHINGTAGLLPIVDERPLDPTSTAVLSLTGERFLTETLIIEWERFFALPDGEGVNSEPQLALEINPTISEPLFNLPHGGRALPRLNLVRGRKVGLPSGQQVAAAMGCPVLDDADLLIPMVDAAFKQRVKEATPLWYYMLCEAGAPPQNGRRLGPVAGRIVAEVLVGLLAGDPESYYRKCPTWQPYLGTTPGDFTMRDLVLIAQGRLKPGSAQDPPTG